MYDLRGKGGGRVDAAVKLAPTTRAPAPGTLAGFLIDTSFNFLSVAAIKGVIDAMSYAKFNILHWHATDDPSWPITSATYPNFTAYGAFSSVAVYSLADQLAIRDYAAERGILILIELDMPGHAQIWKAGNPSYVITCPGGQTLLNPITASGIYDVIRNLIAEYAARFPGMPFIHLGTCGTLAPLPAHPTVYIIYCIAARPVCRRRRGVDPEVLE